MNWSSLLVLICPLMMLFMMFGMKGMHGHGSGRGQHHHAAPGGGEDSGVRRELDELKAQNAQMKEELERLGALRK
ncbi:hypothetical protein KIH86_01750 [Paenibacillus sp. HN-1]|uniref:hypothetical protein n=1 Tax=Paenibacillus TaxID=44249 RepID=UPI001CA9F38A|nr:MULTISPECIES: hypothetical protein [Paenibacillus]MBY9079707.1 hypothetical protein [Paenibacillus sp. CGMCC 1.18879]MBY9082958.1 hypothetical protein [Paenibacillus sinensis]